MINPWLDSAVLWIHILAAISWVGGMIFVAFIVGPYVRHHFPPAERTPLMADIGKRFSYLGWSAILVLVVTGVYNAIRFLGSWDALWQTTFGHILLVKIGLVGVMILLSIVHDFFLGPRQRDLGQALRQRQSEPTRTPALAAPAGASGAASAAQPVPTTPAAESAMPEKAAVERALCRLRRWTILIAQANLLLAILVILLAASLQSF